MAEQALKLTKARCEALTAALWAHDHRVDRQWVSSDHTTRAAFLRQWSHDVPEQRRVNAIVRVHGTAAAWLRDHGLAERTVGHPQLHVLTEAGVALARRELLEVE